MAKRIGFTHLGDIGLPAPEQKTYCGRCVFCVGKSKAEAVPGIGPVKDLAAIFTLKSELTPLEFRRLSEFHDAACVDMGGILLTFFPIWLQDNMIPAILDDIGKILGVNDYRIVNGCG